MLAVALTDELWSGVAVVAAPEVERHHALDHSGYALTVFTLPLLLAALLEVCVSLVAHTVPRRRVLAVALGALAAALSLCALAPNPWLLAAGLSLAGAASGAACAAAEAELVRRNADTLDRAMARWMVFGGIGDVLAPALVALMFACGLSYRVGFMVVLLWVGLQGMSHLCTTSRGDCSLQEEPEPAVSLLTALRIAAVNGHLWLWLAGTALCTLLDELVAALAALRMERELGATNAQAALSLIGYSCGVVIGAIATERLVTQLGYKRILCVSSIVCMFALTSTVLAPTATWAGVSLIAVGMSAAAHYPLLLSQAYKSAPGSAAFVGALAEVFVLVDLTVPLVVGELGDAFGLQWALATLLLQPLGVLALVLSVRGQRTLLSSRPE